MIDERRLTSLLEQLCKTVNELVDEVDVLGEDIMDINSRLNALSRETKEVPSHLNMVDKFLYDNGFESWKL